jgi:flagellar biosynthesis/type III secretory pathway protein FliH
MEAKKTKGRYIKKHDSLSQVVKITEFSFEEIARLKPTHPDNSRSNVIYRRLHSEESFNSGLKTADEIIKVLDPPDKPPIIMPMDFTEDWNRIKNRYASRRGRADEEEEFEMELEYINNKRKQDREKERHGGGAATGKGEESASHPDNNAVMSASRQPVHPVVQDGNEDKPSLQKEVELENAHSNFRINRNTASSFEEMENDLLKDTQDPHGGMEKIASNIEYSARKPVVEEEPPLPQHDENTIDDAYAEEEVERPSQEFRSLSSYLTSPPARTITEEDKSLVEELKAKGYEDGFKLGEEKATLQLKSSFENLSSMVSGAIEEIGALKKNVLLNAQNNFMVLAQALIESVLRHQFSINPEAFLALIRRAIEDAVPDDEFKVLVSPENGELLKQIVDDKVKSKIVLDAGIEPGNFRIDSRLTVVDAKISEIVADLLQQADLSLFNVNDKKAS